jgi:ribosomal protein S24E
MSDYRLLEVSNDDLKVLSRKNIDYILSHRDSLSKRQIVGKLADLRDIIERY